ncbi:MAG: ABC transporter substrate-binding protein [Desulfonatronovibrio sp.]
MITLKKFLISIISTLLFFTLATQSYSDQQKRLVIAQSIKHPALDDVTNGIKKYFKNNGVSIEFMHIIPDPDPEAIDIDAILHFRPHLIITIGTQASQNLSRMIYDIPIVFSAVTDPVGAGLVQDMTKPGSQITGLTDMSPVNDQLEMIMLVQPQIKNIGLIFSEFEQNAVLIKDHLKKSSNLRGINLRDMPVRSGGDVTKALMEIIDTIDALYISTDNYVVSRVGELAEICSRSKIPLYAADLNSVAKGAIAALSIDYFEMGIQTGAMSHRIIQGSDPATMPVEKAEEMNIAINVKAAEKMNVLLPMDLILTADRIYDQFSE